MSRSSTAEAAPIRLTAQVSGVPEARQASAVARESTKDYEVVSIHVCLQHVFDMMMQQNLDVIDA